MKKKIPKFKTEVEERRFWEKHDSTEYLDWSDAEKGVLPRLKPTTKTISIRLPVSMLEELKMLANKRDVSYQSLLKIFLSERIDNGNKYDRHLLPLKQWRLFYEDIEAIS